MTFLIAVQVGIVLRDMVMGRQEEAAGATGGVADRLSGRRAHHVHDRLYQRARGEVLSCTGLDILGVPLQQFLVDGALHVHVHDKPLLAIDEIDNETAKQGRVLDLVLGLAEDEAQHPRLSTQLLQGVAVVHFQVIAVAGEEAGPVHAIRDRRFAVPRRLGLFVGHLEKEEVCKLLEVVAVRETAVTKDAGVAPDLLPNLRVAVAAHSGIASSSRI